MTVIQRDSDTVMSEAVEADAHRLDRGATKSADTPYETMRPYVEAMLARLGESEKAVLELRYGLDDGVPKSFRHIAKKLDIEEREAAALERSALARLQAGANAARSGLN